MGTGVSLCAQSRCAAPDPPKGLEKQKQKQVAQTFCERLIGDYALNGKFKDVGINHSLFL